MNRILKYLCACIYIGEIYIYITEHNVEKSKEYGIKPWD